MTIAGIAIGVLIVAVVAVGQLGGKATGKLVDPGIAYPASIQDGDALGPKDAPVTLEVFEDYQCPVCGSYSLDVEPTIVNSYVLPGKLRIVHHDIDLLGRGGDESKLPAIGAYCANQQGGYWTYAHWIYDNQDGENTGGFRRERVTQIATAAGLDEAAFNTCMDSPEAAAHVADTTAMSSSLGIDSTPTLRINGGELIRTLLSVSQLSAQIDAALAAASGAPAASGSPAASGAPAASGSPAASAPPSTTP